MTRHEGQRNCREQRREAERRSPADLTLGASLTRQSVAYVSSMRLPEDGRSIVGTDKVYAASFRFLSNGLFTEIPGRFSTWV